jgi:hypothetical protein
VMLSPSCERCGCALDAAAVVPEAASSTLGWTIAPRAAAALSRLWLLVGALGLYAAAKVGYHAGGPSGGMIAFGVGGFLLLPFVPQRVGGVRD